MMQALSAGMDSGIVAFHEDDQKLGNVLKDGYIPNPGPLFEVGGNYYDPKWLREQPEGLIVKIFFDGLPYLPAGEWVVIFMERDPREIIDSCKRAERHLRDTGVPITRPRLGFDVYAPYNQEDIDHVKGILSHRIDVKLVCINYADLVNDPIKTLKKVKYTPLGHERIALDVERASKVINSQYWRTRYDDSKGRSKERSTNSQDSTLCQRKPAESRLWEVLWNAWVQEILTRRTPYG